MTVLIGSSLTGSEVQDHAIGEPIKAADVRVILQDQGHAYERTTGLAADQAGTTASSTNAVHRHNHSTSSEGTLLYRHFASWVYGTRGPNGDTDEGNVTLSTFAAPFNITETSATTDFDDLAVMQPLIYVPSGWVGRDILFLLDTSSDPDMVVTVRDTAGTAVTGYEGIRVQPAGVITSGDAAILAASYSPSAFGAVFQVASAGVYRLDVRTNLRQNGGVRVIYGGTVVGVCRPSRGVALDRRAWTQYRDGINVQVGDPDASNAFQPIDDAWVAGAGDSPLHVGLVQKLTENAALIYEKATGLPAPGNDALTITRGHTHSGATGEGSEIGVAHVACVFGGFAGVSITEASGQRSNAPNNDSLSTATLAQGVTYMPRSANVTAGASKLKSAVCIYCDAGKSYQMQVSMTFGGTSKSFNGTAGGAGFEVLTTPTAGTNAYAFTENASNAWDVAWALIAPGSPAVGKAQVCSILWYTEE